MTIYGETEKTHVSEVTDYHRSRIRPNIKAWKEFVIENSRCSAMARLKVSRKL